MALWMWPKATNNFSKTQQALERLALLTACCRQGAARSAIVFHHIYSYGWSPQAIFALPLITDHAPLI